MNEVRKTLVESLGAPVYASPRVKVVQFLPEGIQCTSGLTETFREEDCTNGFWD